MVFVTVNAASAEDVCFDDRRERMDAHREMLRDDRLWNGWSAARLTKSVEEPCHSRSATKDAPSRASELECGEAHSVPRRAAKDTIAAPAVQAGSATQPLPRTRARGQSSETSHGADDAGVSFSRRPSHAEECRRRRSEHSPPRAAAAASPSEGPVLPWRTSKNTVAAPAVQAGSATQSLPSTTRASELECTESGSAESLWKTIGAEKAVLALGAAVAEESYEQHRREAATHRKEAAVTVLQLAVRRWLRSRMSPSACMSSAGEQHSEADAQKKKRKKKKAKAQEDVDAVLAQALRQREVEANLSSEEPSSDDSAYAEALLEENRRLMQECDLLRKRAAGYATVSRADGPRAELHAEACSGSRSVSPRSKPEAKPGEREVDEEGQQSDVARLDQYELWLSADARAALEDRGYPAEGLATDAGIDDDGVVHLALLFPQIPAKEVRHFLEHEFQPRFVQERFPDSRSVAVLLHFYEMEEYSRAV